MEPRPFSVLCFDLSAEPVWLTFCQLKSQLIQVRTLYVLGLGHRCSLLDGMGHRCGIVCIGPKSDGKRAAAEESDYLRASARGSLHAEYRSSTYVSHSSGHCRARYVPVHTHVRLELCAAVWRSTNSDCVPCNCVGLALLRKLETCVLTHQSRSDGPRVVVLFIGRAGGPPLISHVRWQQSPHL